MDIKLPLVFIRLRTTWHLRYHTIMSKDGIYFAGNVKEHHEEKVENVEFDSSTTNSGEEVTKA